MSFHLVTLAFVCLKLAHFIDWSWWLVFLPSIVGVLLVFVINAVGSHCPWKTIKG